ncbi:hypothetical protein VB796_00500 [Arcicella sp. LKC2W]|uniref:hypothetical protein n=1 Tax=Arcicella sp. LKC2W TaxID=2984198 RepID=UPI002B1EEC3E|nr:hypothetical protein [Arcicella sp. LKC2W]MEA5457496.1 hypothetical protein [Arcicella sp. LKC2W]
MKILAIFIILSISFIACQKEISTPVESNCKTAASVPQISFLKLSNIYSKKNNFLGYEVKQDSITLTFKFQDSENDIGINPSEKLFNDDGINQTIFINVLKKNNDGTFSKLSLPEPYNLYLFLPNATTGISPSISNYSTINFFSDCTGEISCSLIFELNFLLLQRINLAQGDKIKFSITLKDRSSHLSNVIETTETTISENP